MIVNTELREHLKKLQEAMKLLLGGVGDDTEDFAKDEGSDDQPNVKDNQFLIQLELNF